MSYYMDSGPAQPALTLLTVEVDYISESHSDVIWYSYPRSPRRWLYSSVMFSPRFQKFHVGSYYAKFRRLH